MADGTNSLSSMDHEQLVQAMSEAIAKAMASQQAAAADDTPSEKWTGDSDGRWNLKDNSNETVYETLKYRFETIATLSGFISGFTYIVASNEVEFVDDIAVISNEVRRELYGAVVSTSFALSLCAALLSSAYLLFLGIAGVENAKWFVQKFYFENKKCGLCRILNLPWYLFNSGLLFMFLGMILVIGGLYKAPVLVVSFVEGVVCIYVFLSIYWKMRTMIRDKHHLQDTEKNLE